MNRMFRLIPMTAMALSLVLALKVSELWRDAGTILVSPAAAETAAPAAAGTAAPAAAGTAALSAAPSDASPGAPTPVTPTATAPSGEGATLKAVSAAPQSTEPAPGAPQSPIDDAAAKPSDPVNLANYTQGELDVLKTLAGRRDQMEAREQELVLRENLLTAAEKKVDQRIAELKKIEERIQAVVSKQETAEEDNLKSLVKVYENMKPKDAARIFENLDGSVLLGVVERMKEAKLALVLALMNPDRAQKLTVELATRRQWPQTVMNSAP